MNKGTWRASPLALLLGAILADDAPASSRCTESRCFVLEGSPCVVKADDFGIASDFEMSRD